MQQEFLRPELRVISAVHLPPATCTLSALVAATGETPRTLNHWTDIGILRPLRSTDRRGRGNRRSYAHDERAYALVAASLNKLRLPLVTTIRHILDIMRDDETHLSAARGGRPDIYALIEISGEGIKIHTSGASALALVAGTSAKVSILLNLSKILSHQ